MKYKPKLVNWDSLSEQEKLHIINDNINQITCQYCNESISDTSNYCPYCRKKLKEEVKNK